MRKDLCQNNDREGLGRDDHLLERAVGVIQREKTRQRQKGGQERGHPDNARGHGAQQILFGAHTERHERDHHGKEKERLNDVAFLAQRQHQVAPHDGQKEVKHGSPPPRIPQQKRDAWGQRPTRPP